MESSGVPFWPIAFVVVAALLIVGLQIKTWLSRRRKTYQELLEPELDARGFKFIIASTPRLSDQGPFLDAGPFPKLEI